MGRSAFLWRCCVKGYRWLDALTNKVSTPITVLALLGLSGGLGVWLEWWVGVIAAAVLFLIVFAEGAFLVWKEEADKGFQVVQKVPVVNRTFENQRVELDGYSYSNCTFENVTLVYRGVKPFDLSHCTIQGAFFISLGDSAPLSALVVLLKELGWIAPDKEIR